MRKFLFVLFILLTFLLTAEENLDISLKEVTIIDLCNYPNLTEAIVDLLYLTVDNLWHAGKYSKIFPIFYLITKIAPYDVNAYAVGGWFLINGIAPKYSDRKKEEIKNYAIEFMKNGIKKNPSDYRLYFEIAWFYYNEKNYDEAIKYLEIAENYEHPFHVENLKAHIYMKINNKTKAIEVWKKIKEKYPEKKEVAEKFIRKLEEE
ncbi:MAG: tetratricopeptide repeat protein [Candidatus Omnitrophica bacterium]|nr:tetratricopeptide repeat protein [Candidatus Omnitrophota bacterium]MCM8806631.1 tetratricopeptide repeat protein [Candidatus Omnitrophota bacterium]